MTPQQFRKLALALPDVEERSHMNHPDFRVGGKIFATLGYPGTEYAMVVLSPVEQKNFVQSNPGIFAPAKGAWGRRGSTHIHLASVDRRTLSDALNSAWNRRAPKRAAKAP
jgi:hypothetical protein